MCRKSQSEPPKNSFPSEEHEFSAMPAAKSKTVSTIQAVLGSDDAEVKQIARTLAEEMTPAGGGDFGRDIVDGTASGADDAAQRVHQTIEALLTLPFFGGEKLVWLKDANFLGDSTTGRAAAVGEALEELATLLSKGLPDGVRFLLSAGEADKRRGFYKNLQKMAKVTVCDKLDTSKAGWEETAMDLGREIARGYGVAVEEDALELLAVRTGGDRRTMQSELEKLQLYRLDPSKAIMRSDVDTLVPMTGAAGVFELGNAVASRDTQRCLGLLEQLFNQEESPIGILLVAIIPTVRNLLAVKDLMERHRLSRPAQAFFFGKTLEKLPDEAKEHLPRKKDGSVNAFALGIAAQHAHRYTLPELRKAQRKTLEANVALVSSAQDPKGILQQLILELTLS
jgi:DNA polymerase-3 subunit delta